MAGSFSQANLLQHVAIIMDGNRRWAAKRGLGAVEGHKVAAQKTIKSTVKHAIKRGIKYLTFWAFSTENKKRDKEELEGLFAIFRDALQSNVSEMDKLGVRIKIIGDISWFPKDIATAAGAMVSKTSGNSKLTVSFALNYGGREEILRAVGRIIDRIAKSQRSASAPVTEEEFGKSLDTAGIPDPDLIIRPGGDKRLSGYLPWQSVYSELYFTKTLWPDFTPAKFDLALVDYARRNRRFGGGNFADYMRRKATKIVADKLSTA